MQGTKKTMLDDDTLKDICYSVLVRAVNDFEQIYLLPEDKRCYSRIVVVHQDALHFLASDYCELICGILDIDYAFLLNKLHIVRKIG